MENINNSWLTEEYLLQLGYYKIRDDGQYGEYNNLHNRMSSPTYGSLPRDYRKINFNRDSKHGVFLGVKADWDTRYSIQNALAQTKEIFEILLNSSI